jgi:hypothetical protein
MDLRETLNTVSKILTENKIEFALIGGVALSAYVAPRMTFDIDILVDGAYKNKIIKLLTDRGFRLEMESENVLQFSGNGYVDFLLANKELSKQMIKSSEVVDQLGVHVVSPEDIIGLKIQAYCNDPSRELQDKADIYNLMKNYKTLNIEKVKKYADIFNQWPAIEDLWKKR